MNEKYMILDNNILMTKGYNRGLLASALSSEYYFVPNSLIDFINKNNKLKIEQIYLSYKPNEHIVINEYIDWLFERNFIMLCDNNRISENISYRKQLYETPFQITNCIIELSKETKSIISEIINELDLINLPHLEIWAFEDVTLIDLIEIVKLIQESSIQSLNLIVKYTSEMSIKKIKAVFEFSTVINELKFFSAPSDKIHDIHLNMTKVIFISELVDKNCCGKVLPEYFSINHTHFAESIKYNTCLNKKITIDKNCFVKNCPNIKEVFGNLKFEKLEVILKRKRVKRLWNINKDKIKSCKDCEFRHYMHRLSCICSKS